MVVCDLDRPTSQDYFARWLQKVRDSLSGLCAQVHTYGLESMRTAGGKPLAAVFDIDEVLLCNIRNLPGGTFRVEDQFASPSELLPAEAQAADEPLSSTWPRDELWAHTTHSGTGYNPAFPGARELLEQCEALGMTLFFVTGRLEPLRAETIENFRLVGFPVSELEAGPDSRLQMCPADFTGPVAPFKEAAHAKIAADYCIVMNVGDQLSDLSTYADRQFLISHAFYTTP